MKTPDWLSKKRQALSETELTWRVKLSELGRTIAVTQEARDLIAQQKAFCLAEITKCQLAQVELGSVSRRQRAAGWGVSFR